MTGFIETHVYLRGYSNYEKNDKFVLDGTPPPPLAKNYEIFSVFMITSFWIG